MSLLGIRIIVSILMKFGTGIAWTILKELAASISEQRASLTPEQREELDKIQHDEWLERREGNGA